MDHNLSLDLRDVALWLEASHPGPKVHLCADCNYSAELGTISHVVVFHADQETRRALREEATAALVALGYSFGPTGGDVYDVAAAARGEMSAHQKFHSVQRIRNAFDGRITSARDYAPPRPTQEEVAAMVVDDDF